MAFIFLKLEGNGDARLLALSTLPPQSLPPPRALHAAASLP